jgi:hypothetical protein
MGADPVTLSIAGGVLMGAASANGAASQNRAIGRAMGSTVSASEDAMNQIQTQTAIASQRYINDARKARGAIRVAGAAGGVRGDDLAAIVRQTAYDAELNTAITKMDAAAKIGSVRSNAQAQLERLESQGKSVLFETAKGGLQGAMAGYSIGSFFAPAAAATSTAGAAGSAFDAVAVPADPALGGIVY